VDPSTPVLGAIPKLDSMAVVIADDEISGATFATLGTLTAFVKEKVDQ
jgi:hypothetical protein